MEKKITDMNFDDYIDSLLNLEDEELKLYYDPNLDENCRVEL